MSGPTPAPAPAAGGEHKEEKQKRTFVGWLIFITLIILAIFVFCLVNGITLQMAFNSAIQLVSIVGQGLRGLGRALQQMSKDALEFTLGLGATLGAILGWVLVGLIAAIAFGWAANQMKSISKKQEGS